MLGLPGASDPMELPDSARALLHRQLSVNEHYYLGKSTPSNVSAEVLS